MKRGRAGRYSFLSYGTFILCGSALGIAVPSFIIYRVFFR